MNPIKFDKTIYLDRFMLENKSLVDLGKGGIDKYKEKVRRLKEGLQKYTSFGDGKIDLRKSLKATIEYIKSQSNDEITMVDMYEGVDIVYDPRGIGVVKNSQEMVKTLEQNLTLVTQQIEQMEKILAEYEEIIIRFESMKKYAFDLHTILMHSGGAESGHYYSFIYDAATKVWRKYNDENVTEVSEENVFTEAIGDGKAPASAYFLIYTARSMETERKGSGRDFALSASKLIHAGTQEVNYYTTLLPPELKREVCEDNLKLDLEIMEKKASWICANALDIYQKRHAKLLQNKKLKGYTEWSFIAYLEESKSPLYRYCLLDTIISELNEGNISLDVLDEYDPIYRMLNDTLMKQCRDPPASLTISEADKRQIEALEKGFHKLNIDRKVQLYIIGKLMAKDWPIALDAISYYITSNIYYDTATKKIVEDLLRLFMLCLMSLISFHIMNKKVPQAIVILKYITQKCAKFLAMEDPHIVHTKRYLTFLFGECNTVLEGSEAAEVAAELKKLGTQKVHEVAVTPASQVYFKG